MTHGILSVEIEIHIEIVLPLPCGAGAVEGGDHDAAVLFHVHTVQRKVLDDLSDDLASRPDNLRHLIQHQYWWRWERTVCKVD